MRVGIVIPGQGSQYIGMGKKLYERYHCVKEIFNEANEILGYDLLSLCFNGDIKMLQQSMYTQPAVFTTSYASYIAFIDEYNIKPVCIAGHSMGEITALVCANAIDFKQGLQLISQRGRIMQKAVAGGLGGMYAVINMKREELECECQKVSDKRDYVVISNYNSSNQYTISGSLCALEKVIPAINGKGGITIPLKVSGPFHSMYMKQAAEEFGEFLNIYTFKSPEYLVISNYTGKEYELGSDLKESLVKQMYSPVMWSSCIQSMLKNDVDIMLETGPKNVLSKLIRQQTGLRIYASDREQELGEFYKVFGCDCETYIDDASRIDALVRNCLKIAVCIRNDGVDDFEYEQKFRIPYSEIKMKYLMHKDNNETIPYEIAKSAVNILRTACRVKGVSKEIEKKILKKLMIDTGTKSVILEQV